MNTEQQKVLTFAETISEMLLGVLVFLPFYVDLLTRRFHPAILQFFQFPYSDSGDDPPWHYIRDDFATGIGALGLLLFFFVLASVCWKRYRRFGEVFVFSAILWEGGHIIKAAIIYFSCPDFLYPTAASPWPTFDSYFNDTALSVGFWIPMGIGLGLAINFGCRRKPAKPAEEDLTTKSA